MEAGKLAVKTRWYPTGSCRPDGRPCGGTDCSGALAQRSQAVSWRQDGRRCETMRLKSIGLHLIEASPEKPEVMSVRKVPGRIREDAGEDWHLGADCPYRRSWTGVFPKGLSRRLEAIKLFVAVPQNSLCDRRRPAHCEVTPSQPAMSSAQFEHTMETPDAAARGSRTCSGLS